MAILTNTELRVLKVIGSFGQNPPTIDGLVHQMNHDYGEVITNAKMRGIITKLVHGGYVRRTGTDKMRWYRLTRYGQGYISDEVVE
jgi:hypothetical protein